MNSIVPKAYIHLDRLLVNIENIHQYVGGQKLMCVVKANGYGHGAVQIANALLKYPEIIFAVFSFEEAIELREHGIKNDLFIFSKLQPNLLSKALELNLILNSSAITDLQELAKFKNQNGSCPNFHIKFDTGMTRLGFNLKEQDEVFKFLKENDLDPDGIYSHFSTADEGDLSFAKFQLEQFNNAVDNAKSSGIYFNYIHCSNSGAILNMPESYFNLIRVGMLMYGVAPSDEVSMTVDVEPVMSFCGPIVNIRQVAKGTQISYGGIYTTEKETNIAVVQTGFADGFPRPWFEDGYVSYNGKHYKIAGRVCMDQLMVDFGDDLPEEGEEVLFFGKKDGNEIPVEIIAKSINSTTYVLLTAIHGRTKRISIKN